MKYLLGVLISLGVGIILGFFGVLNSVFSDAGLSERIITILVTLIIYAVLSALLAIFLQGYSWQWGVLLSAPGILMLILYMLSEFNIFYPVYMILLLAVSCLGAFGGGKIKNWQKNRLNRERDQ